MPISLTRPSHELAAETARCGKIEPMGVRTRLLSRGGHVPLRDIRRPWPQGARRVYDDPDDVPMFGLGLPYVELTVDEGGVLLRGGLLAQALLRNVRLPVGEIRFACRAKSKSRFSALKYLGIRTVSQETYLLDFTAGGLEQAVEALASHGLPVEPGWWLSSPRTGGFTLEPPTESER